MAPKTIQSTVAFQDPAGNVLAGGSIIFDLSAPAEITSGGGIVAPMRVSVTLDSTGKIPAATLLYGNDQLSPGGTIYYVRIYNSNGLLVSGPLFWSITGSSPIDLSQEFPVATSTLSFSLPGINEQQFTSNGTFTIPAAITKVKVMVVGAGGAGGGSNGANAGTGGGSGGAGIKWLSGLTPGNTLTVAIGGGGLGVSAGTGAAGGSCSVSSGTQVITSIVVNPGSGGAGTQAGISGGGLGGTIGTGGDINLPGIAGGAVWSATGSVGGSGAPSILGGFTSNAVNNAGANAIGFGSGGGGAQGTGPFAGGNGAPGIAIFEWVA